MLGLWGRGAGSARPRNSDHSQISAERGCEGLELGLYTWESEIGMMKALRVTIWRIRGHCPGPGSFALSMSGALEDSSVLGMISNPELPSELCRAKRWQLASECLKLEAVSWRRA